MTFSHDGRRLVSGSHCEVKVWDAESGQHLITLGDQAGRVKCVAASPNDERIVVARTFGNKGPHDIIVWDTSSGQELRRFAVPTGHVNSVAFSPDGKRIVSAARAPRREGTRATYHSPGEIKVWEVTQGKQLLSIPGRLEYYCAAFSADGKRIVGSAAYLDRSFNSVAEAKAWDATTGQEICTLEKSDRIEFVSVVSYSPDSRRIVGIVNSETIKVWDATTGKQLLTLSGHVGRITSATFSPDGTQIVSTSGIRKSPGELKFWDATGGRELLTLYGHQDLITSVACSPDGSRLCTASNDRTLKIWNLSNGDVLKSVVQDQAK